MESRVRFVYREYMESNAAHNHKSNETWDMIEYNLHCFMKFRTNRDNTLLAEIADTPQTDVCGFKGTPRVIPINCGTAKVLPFFIGERKYTQFPVCRVYSCKEKQWH